MPRLVRHDAIGPVKIDPATLPLGEDGKPKKIAVCACGLSRKFPVCDGTHKTLTEQPDKLYIYDPATCHVVEERPLESHPVPAMPVVHPTPTPAASPPPATA
jgi:CDGSH-type Zn-finger protein